MRFSEDRGDASSEFVMVSALVLLLFMLVLQFSFALFARNILQDAASQGARYGALLDRSAADGVQRAEELVHSVLPDSYQVTVSSQETQWQGARALEVTILAPVPLVGPWGGSSHWEIKGHALQQ